MAAIYHNKLRIIFIIALLFVSLFLWLAIFSHEKFNILDTKISKPMFYSYKEFGSIDQGFFHLRFEHIFKKKFISIIIDDTVYAKRILFNINYGRCTISENFASNDTDIYIFHSIINEYNKSITIGSNIKSDALEVFNTMCKFDE